MAGISATIYKDRGQDWSSNGLSSTADKVLVLDVPRGNLDTPSAEYPPVLVVPGNTGGAIVVPAMQDDDGKWVPMRIPGVIGPMAGGCYVATSDSRFSELVERVAGHRIYAALPLHDRFETQEQYDFLSHD